jgi:predicted AlkP superfamily pyrophosphatase or phosphodiesterase
MCTMVSPSHFAGLPDHIEQRARAGERVLVVLLDAFGMRFVERHVKHPLLRRLDAIEPLEAQFPTTTTAEMTTLHTGLPVGLHGLYEWNVYEPSLQRVITPLRFSFAGDTDPDTLAAHGFDSDRLFADEPTLYERLGSDGVPSFVYEPSSFSPSTYGQRATRGAELRPYDTLADGMRSAVEALRAVDRGYALVYFDEIDAVGHINGPSSAEFAAAATAALDTVDAALADASGLSVLLTADHGQVDVDPAATIWLEELHPPLGELALRPAGSARDVFLHVPEAQVDATLDALDPHVETHRVEDMIDAGAFGPRVGEQLRRRLATVCVLPQPDRMAWLRSASDGALQFRGHHGGRTPDESRTWLGTLAAR